jgi:hypothetical protein
MEVTDSHEYTNFKAKGFDHPGGDRRLKLLRVPERVQPGHNTPGRQGVLGEPHPGRNHAIAPRRREN